MVAEAKSEAVRQAREAEALRARLDAAGDGGELLQAADGAATTDAGKRRWSLAAADAQGQEGR